MAGSERFRAPTSEDRRAGRFPTAPDALAKPPTLAGDRNLRRLDHQLGGRRHEVGDVVAEWNLATERDTETATTDFGPEASLPKA